MMIDDVQYFVSWCGLVWSCCWSQLELSNTCGAPTSQYSITSSWSDFLYISHSHLSDAPSHPTQKWTELKLKTINKKIKLLVFSHLIPHLGLLVLNILLNGSDFSPKLLRIFYLLYSSWIDILYSNLFNLLNTMLSRNRTSFKKNGRITKEERNKNLLHRLVHVVRHSFVCHVRYSQWEECKRNVFFSSLSWPSF